MVTEWRVCCCSIRQSRTAAAEQNWTISSIKRNLIQLSAWNMFCVYAALLSLTLDVQWRGNVRLAMHYNKLYERSVVDLVLRFMLLAWRNFCIIFSFSTSFEIFFNPFASLHGDRDILLNCSLSPPTFSLSCKPGTKSEQQKFHWIIAEKKERSALKNFGVSRISYSTKFLRYAK